jgi:hypothetical protein
VGDVVGDAVGDVVGDAEGDVVGDCVGDAVGLVVGDVVGDAVGDAVGDFVGDTVGDIVGDIVGLVVGDAVGDLVGLYVISSSVASSQTHVWVPDKTKLSNTTGPRGLEASKLLTNAMAVDVVIVSGWNIMHWRRYEGSVTGSSKVGSPPESISMS